MAHKPSNYRIWGAQERPILCENCRKMEAVIFLCSRPLDGHVIDPMYLCSLCHLRMAAEIVEHAGFLVVPLPEIHVQLSLDDALEDIRVEQVRKAQNWSN